jgi:hypothetical protein
VPSVTLKVAPVAKLILVAAGRFEPAGAEVGAATVDVEVAGRGVALGKGVEVGCVGLTRGVIACRVSAAGVKRELPEGMDVTEPPQATVTKRSTAMARVSKVCGLYRFIFLLVTTIIVSRQKPVEQVQ